MMKRRLPPTIVALGVVSLLTDVSSEMIYPLLPLFLTTVLAAGPEVLGVIEGVAESTAALLKLVSGVWADRVRRRKPLVFAGYTVAGIARPLIGLAASWPVVLGLRFTDRIGKGLRTSPRDALIADAVEPATRGRAFGLQRAMDHAGAVTGPLVAAALLHLAGFSLRHIFLLAAVPAALVILVLALLVHERPREAVAPVAVRPLADWRALGRPFRRVMLAVMVFTLGNSTDAFLLLYLSAVGIPADGVAVVWSAFSLVKVGAAYLGGRLSDRLGRRSMVLAGWGWYAAVYVAFALVASPMWVVAVFLAYGVYYGLTEPVEKAWVAELAPARLRGTAFGVYNGGVGLAALPASVLFGALWNWFGAPAAFAVGAGLAAVAAVLLLAAPPSAGGDGEAEEVTPD
jgi:MFS family permease